MIKNANSFHATGKREKRGWVGEREREVVKG
jgi:hypothetical protein